MVFKSARYTGQGAELRRRAPLRLDFEGQQRVLVRFPDALHLDLEARDGRVVVGELHLRLELLLIVLEAQLLAPYVAHHGVVVRVLERQRACMHVLLGLGEAFGAPLCRGAMLQTCELRRLLVAGSCERLFLPVNGQNNDRLARVVRVLRLVDLMLGHAERACVRLEWAHGKAHQL